MKAGRFHDGTWVCFKRNGMIFINGKTKGRGILLELYASSVRLDPPLFDSSWRFVGLVIHAGEMKPHEQPLDVDQSRFSSHWALSTATSFDMLLIPCKKHQVLGQG